MPDVTVLMAVYNGEAYLRPAIDSILAQTYGEFEFLIVDDGSTDATAQICRGYQDPRIRLVSLPKNGGLSEALNAGLRETRTPLVARLDADDVAEPGRLARQRDVMLARPELALLGSQATAMTAAGAVTGIVRRSLEPASIAWSSVFDNPFAHTTAMFRTAVIRGELGGFRKEYDPFSQDYDLWCRVMERHPVANLPDRLVRHRVHDSSIMGMLGGAAGQVGYDRRFDHIARTLIVRQARRLFGEAAIGEDEARLLPGLVLGIEAADVGAFLSLFERLLHDFRARQPAGATTTGDFALTLARQFDALAVRARGASRATTLRILAHELRCHPALASHVSWPRTLTLLLLGQHGRDRVGAWTRRYRSGVARS